MLRITPNAEAGEHSHLTNAGGRERRARRASIAVTTRCSTRSSKEQPPLPQKGGPLQDLYAACVARGTTPELAKVTLARKIASIALGFWKKGELWSQRPRTTLTPTRRSSVFARESFPTLSVNTVLSSVMTCETFATESFGNPVVPAESSTLPGASAQARLLVSGTQTTVAILLRLKALPCTTTTDLGSQAPIPSGGPSPAHHTAPCEITTPLSPECAEQRFG